ncbi:MAG: hypothetical protein F6K00_13005 [Leptolyngbya sp. SIOISBB]|nr:hypothetical protein [Leptolyngbya sp. SIOISBB]
MNHEPQNSRHQAARNFVNALDELESVLKSEQPESDPEPLPDAVHPSTPPQSPERSADDLKEADFGQLLDDAVQDIEQFMAADESSPQDP